jgi:hypothetical protein
MVSDDLVLLNSIKVAQFFKLFRYLKIGRIIKYAEVLQNLILDKNMRYYVVIYNIFHMCFTLIFLTLVIHIGTCGWIAIGFIDGGWIDQKSIS